MIKKTIAWSAHNKFLVLALTGVAMAAGWYCMKNMRLDAIPDLSDTQVIVYSRWDRSPDIIEDQVTYPIVTALLGAPNVKAVRGFSDFGFSYVYVIFQDGTDIYWARSRVLEYLSKIQSQLPEGVRTELGPDATGVGWVYQYALVDRTGRHSLADIRSFQDWNLRYHLQAVPGVAEVASIGGFQKQYQVQVDPNALSAYRIPLAKVVDAVRDGNNDVGGRLVEFGGAEYMIRGRGYAKSVEDLEQIVVGRDKKGTPVLVRSVAKVTLGPDIRRGVADLDGEGDTVGGIVVIRHGENALRVIEKVKARLAELKPSLPEGVEVVVTYDRSTLIEGAIATLKHELFTQMLLVSLVLLVFLWHIPSAIVPIVTIPISTLLAFIPLYFMGVSANIMSIAGIMLSVGVLVDGSMVEVENAYKKLQLWDAGGRKGDYHAVRLQAMQEVGPSVFYSLLIVAVAFLPIFALVDQEGRLFKPLAYTKNLTMFLAAFLAVTLDPAVRMMFSRMDFFVFKPNWLAWTVNQTLVGRYYAEEKHPISKGLFRLYDPVCRWVLERPWKVIGTAALVTLATVPIYLRLGSEFMPPLNEGTMLYMPTTLPGISVTQAAELLQKQDEVLKSFPEVEHVFGKAGRAETSTDSAPFSMMETTVLLKPREQWRAGMTWDKLVAEMDQHMKFPGVTNAWTMPIKARIDMLTTGVRTPIGIKVQGADLAEIEALGMKVETALRDVSGTRSVYAERTAGGYYVDFRLKRDQLARYGLSVKEVEMVIMSAIGGEPVTVTVEGRERYGVSVRYPRELRDNLPKLRRVLVSTMDGAQIPLAQLADIELTMGPAMIRNENGLLTGYVYVDVAGRDIGSYVDEAKKKVAAEVVMPAGYALRWSGQYENMARVREKMALLLPLTLVGIILLMYMNTKSWAKTGIVMLAVPFSLIGAFWGFYLLDYNLSVAAWVGMIALMGLDAETGTFMLLYLDLAYADAVREGRMRTFDDLKEAVVHGAVKRIRPKMMTVFTDFLGLMPVMWAVGTGSDLMKRIAAPIIFGLFTSFTMELVVYPAIYLLWKWHGDMKKGAVVPHADALQVMQD
ncbi:MAG: efflux RND transporter permease subunit [Elusimicrobia bacterium]|nr:efflux RND transporter permease subunit [Elusimicrobiota bacterium]